MRNYTKLDDIPLDEVFRHNILGYTSLVKIQPKIDFIVPNKSYIEDYLEMAMNWDCWNLRAYEFDEDAYENYLVKESIRLMGYDNPENSLKSVVDKSLSSENNDSPYSQSYQYYNNGFCTRTDDYHDLPTNLKMFGDIARDMHGACVYFLKHLDTAEFPIMKIIADFAASDAEDRGDDHISIESTRMRDYVEVLNKGLDKLYKLHRLETIYPFLMDEDLGRYLENYPNTSYRTKIVLDLYQRTFRPIYKRLYEYLLHELNSAAFMRILKNKKSGDGYCRFIKELKKRSPEPIVYGIGTCSDQNRLDNFITRVGTILDDPVDEEKDPQIIKNFARYFVIL